MVSIFALISKSSSLFINPLGIFPSTPIIIILLLESFSHQRYPMVSHWSLSDNKTPQVSRILADLNNAVVWIVSTRPFISKFSSLFTKPLMTVSRAPTTIGINLTFMFHSFFHSLPKSRYLSFFSLSYNFTLWSAGAAKFPIRQVLFFLLIISSDRLAEIRWSVCISKSQRSLCVSFSRRDAELCIYHLFVWSN